MRVDVDDEIDFFAEPRGGQEGYRLGATAPKDDATAGNGISRISSTSSSETVDFDTPAARARSMIVGRLVDSSAIISEKAFCPRYLSCRSLFWNVPNFDNRRLSGGQCRMRVPGAARPAGGAPIMTRQIRDATTITGSICCASHASR